MHDALVQVYAKYPKPGHTKTRLGSTLGNALAARLHLAMLDDSVARYEPLAADEIITELWGDAPRTATAYAQLLCRYPAVKFHRQIGQSLGERLSTGLKAGLQRSRAVLLVGADCPQLSADVVRSAVAALSDHDAVVVPASDGGYVLLGLTRHIPAVFDNIAWSTERVLDQTQSALAGAGCRVATLPVLSDIDTIDDLRRSRATQLWLQ